MIFRTARKSSPRVLQTLGVLLVAGFVAFWGPAAQLFRIVEAPAEGRSPAAELRLVVKVLPAQTSPLPGKGKQAGEQEKAPDKPEPVDLIQALSLDGETPAAPRLTQPVSKDPLPALSFETLPDLIQGCQPTLWLDPPAIPSSGDAGAANSWQDFSTGCMLVPRGPPHC